VGSSDIPRRPYDFWIEGPLVYVADFDGGLLILDASDPWNPVQLSRLTTSTMARCVLVDGNLAYVADAEGNSGVQVVDVSDPRAPFVIGYLPADRACDLELINDHLLVGSWFDPLLVAPIECDVTSSVGSVELEPATITLGFAANPSLAGVVVRLQVLHADDVRLTLHDAQGRRVRQLHHGHLGTGLHVFAWDGRDQRGRLVAAGSYFARLASDTSVISKRFVLLR
jgi:hypothetical protein